MKPIPIQRNVIPEMMDRLDAIPEELIEDLGDLMQLNHYGGGKRLMCTGVKKTIRLRPWQKDWTVLDVATGAGDIPRSLVDCARQEQINLRVTAIDLHPVTLNYARERSNDYPEIRFESGNLLSMPYAENSFDIVTCSQTLHHFGSDEIVGALAKMGRIARHAVVIGDLRRNLLSYLIVWLSVHLTGASRFARHDAPASICNGFKSWELRELARRAGLYPCSISGYPVLRLALTWLKTAPA